MGTFCRIGFVDFGTIACCTAVDYDNSAALTDAGSASEVMNKHR